MSFYEYRQNNSGGSFEYDERAGISVSVIIEARTADHADYKAEAIGLYFDGDGDCSCCGQRWCKANPYDAQTKPCVYDTPVEEYDPKADPFGMKWIDGYETFVHYADGTIKGFHK